MWTLDKRRRSAGSRLGAVAPYLREIPANAFIFCFFTIAAMTSYRPFRPDDLFRTGLCNLDALTENYDLFFYFQYLAKWPDMFLVAEDIEGNIIGYIMGKTEADPDYYQFSEHYLPWHGHITALTVAPQYRRMGLGRSLTERLEEACDAQNAWFMDLFVRKGNVAVGMYKGMGYSVYRRVLKYYSDDPTGRSDGEDAFDMRKPLSRDKNLEHIRADGENHTILPEDMWHP